MKNIFRPRFSGNWDRRLSGVIDAVNYNGRDVLDVGCNMGIVGYEICKQKPNLYHGVERTIILATCARMIFSGVNVENRIFIQGIVKFLNKNKQKQSKYDLVLYLAVHQHLRHQLGDKVADQVAINLFSIAKEALLFRGPDAERLKRIAVDCDFYPEMEVPSEENSLIIFKRVEK